MNISLRDSLVIRQEVVFRELGDEAVLLNLKTGTYFGFDPVGARIWRLIVEHGSLARVLEVMLEEYEVEPGMLERDLLELCRQLCAKGLGDLVPARPGARG
jgi:hypothetical protein